MILGSNHHLTGFPSHEMGNTVNHHRNTSLCHRECATDVNRPFLLLMHFREYHMIHISSKLGVFT